MTSEYVTMYYGFSRWGKEKAKVVQNICNFSDCRHLGEHVLQGAIKVSVICIVK